MEGEDWRRTSTPYLHEGKALALEMGSFVNAHANNYSFDSSGRSSAQMGTSHPTEQTPTTQAQSSSLARTSASCFLRSPRFLKGVTPGMDSVITAVGIAQGECPTTGIEEQE
eukprot:15430182-Alexandrium_andersonii.AAC.1